MKPLIVLFIAFAISLVATRLFKARNALSLSGRISMSVMLVFTAIAHFSFTSGMEMMLPSFIPYITEVIYLTGIIEIAAAIGLLVPALRIITAWLLIAFFILILPANIYAAVRQVNYQEATYTGNGLNYLWFRVPLQLLFIFWTYLFGIKQYGKKLNTQYQEPGKSWKNLKINN